jgi:hypothetical protein
MTASCGSRVAGGDGVPALAPPDLPYKAALDRARLARLVHFMDFAGLTLC